MSTPITLSMPAASNIGINYYHESMGYIGRTNAQIQQDLNNIAAVTKNIKVYLNPLPKNAGGVSHASAVAIVTNIVQMAKAQGFHVVWVENVDQGKVLTDSTTNAASNQYKWADYVNLVVADAASAQAAGADEFLVGNELIGSTHYYSTDPGTGSPTAIYNSANFPSHVSSLVDSCRAKFSGTIGYQEVNTVSSMWTTGGTTANLLHLDKIYFDLYEKWANFQDKASSFASIFGSSCAIGEVSAVDVLGNISYYTGYTENDYSRELMRRYDWLRQKGIVFYAFTYGDPSTNSNGFGLRKNTSDNNTFHDIWNYFLGQKNITYNQQFYDVFPPNDFTGGSGGTGGELDVTNTATSALATATAADFVFRGRAKHYSSSGSYRIVARYTDANNYYAINVDVGNNQLKFIRRQGGVETQIGATVPWPPHGSYSGSLSGSTFTYFDFEIRVQGSGSATQVWASWDTYCIANQIDTGNTLAGTQLGMLYVSGTNAGMLNVVVSDLEAYNSTSNTPTASVSPISLSFSATAGGSNPASQTATLSNTGSASGSYSTSIGYGANQPTGWLTVTPGSGTIAGGASQVQTCSANVSGLPAGTYTATVTFTLGTSTATVSVTFTVASAGGGGGTALSLFFANAASATLASGNQLYSISGSPSNTWKYTTVGIATGYSEIYAQGTSNAWQAGSSIGNPSGNGFFLDGSTLSGKTIQAGTWSANVRINCSQGGDTNPEAGTLTADIILRVYKYNAGVYTPIVTLTSLSQTIPSAFTTFALPSATGAAVAFGASDHLYIDLWLNIKNNNNNATNQGIRLNRLSTDTTGFTGDPNCSVATPGYIVTSGSTTVTKTIVEIATGSEIVYAIASPKANAGQLATWTWDTTNSRVKASGGKYAYLLYNAPVTGPDVDVSAIIDQAEDAGFVWRFQDQYNAYVLAIHDASSATNPNTLQLFVINGGNKSQLGSNVAINFARGTPHAFRVQHTQNTISITMDGSSVLTWLDNSISNAGFAGMRNNGGNAQFYLFRVQYFGQDVTHTTVYSRVRLTSSDPTVTPQVINLSVSARNANVQAGALIPLTKYSILNGNKTYISQALDDLAKQSGNYLWKNTSGQFSFLAPQATPAPFAVTGNDVLINGLQIDNINDQYFNSYWLTGGKDVVPFTQQFIGDGVTSVFHLTFPIDSVTSMTLNNIGQVIGAPQSIGVSGIDTGRQWYYTQGQISLAQAAGAIPLSDTQILTVTYNGQVNITTNTQRPSEIARLSAIDNTSGMIEFAEDAQGQNKQAMIVQSDGKLTQYGQKGKHIQFNTLRSGLAVGQLVAIFNVMGIFAGAFLIIEVKDTWTSTNQNGVPVLQCWHEIHAISGPMISTWTRFISNLGS